MNKKTLIIIALGAGVLGYILYNKNKVNKTYNLSADSISKKNDIIAFAKRENIYTNNLDNALDAMGPINLNYVYDYRVASSLVSDKSKIPASINDNFQKVKKQYNIFK